MRYFLAVALFSLVTVGGFSQSTSPKMMQPSDIYRMKQIRQPKVSPDGKWILYSLSQVDSAKDRNTSKLYMVGIDGKETICLTEQTKNPGSHDWSPDGKYISFLASSKEGESTARQLFLMDRRGGEPFQLTNFKGDIAGYDWSSDGKTIVFAIGDPSTADTAKTNVRKPFEITRYQFKQDYEGYLDTRKTHLYAFDLASKKTDTLTRGNFNETNPSFSHDGTSLVYVSNITTDPDRNSNTDVFLMNLKSKSTKQLTTFKGSNGSPSFSPDDKYIAYTQSVSEDSFNMYDVQELCILKLGTGKSDNLTHSIDRSIDGYVWASDGKSILGIIEDDRKQNIIQLDLAGKGYTRITSEDAVYSNIQANDAGQVVVLFSDPHTPAEIYTLENGKTKKLTHIHDAFLSSIKKIHVQGFQSVSADKNVVSGILYLPDAAAKNLPLVLFIHGGPVAQDEYSFDQARQILAAGGFAVAAVNYRGSSGRGYAYSKSIYGDWGNKEVQDIVGAANHLIKMGVADSNRLAIGGWSYGGILTNYTIATDTRFKAAVSGAGSSFQFTMYGTDQYVKQYDDELGPPWRNFQKWVNLSYPFLNVQKIKTPTLFMASEKDFNVPVAGAEQMYQAFKYEGIPTELIIYPGQNHGISVPSYIAHRYQRHLDWFKKFLK
jgi:dipeptidyl aminopeptidase/acylaminoacyl peptidase